MKALIRVAALLALGMVAIGAAPEQAELSPEQQRLVGADTYMRRCALCHGPQGRGDGPVARGLTVKPTNFGAEHHEEGGARAMDEMFRIVYLGGAARGLSGQMPGFSAILAPDAIGAVVTHVEGLHGQGGEGR